MLEISPVLSGKFDSPDYFPASANVNAATSSSTTAASAATDTDASSATSSATADPRRYSQFDRTASQVGDATMSFGDFLDMVNPLQHIPVVSSLYRDATDEKINPVSRIVGDILYGAPLGIVTALANGVGAIADSVMESKTGQDMKGTVLSELFGKDKDAAGDSNVQVASAQTGTKTQIASAATVAAAAGTPAAQPSQGIALTAKNTTKLPYGGVMAPVQTTQQQNMAMAMASAASGKSTRLGNTLYTNRFLNGPRPAPTYASTAPASAAPASGVASAASLQTLPGALPATAVPAGVKTVLTTGTMTPVTIPVASANAASASPAITAAASTANAAPVDRAIPKELSDDALIMKALGLYQSVGARSGTPATATIN